MEHHTTRSSQKTEGIKNRTQLGEKSKHRQYQNCILTGLHNMLEKGEKSS